MKKTTYAVGAAIILGLAIPVLPASGQTNSTWIGGATDGGVWSNASLWNPAVVPNGNYNVTLPWNPSGAQFNGPELDLNITVENLTLVNRVFLDNQSVPGTGLTVNGTTAVTTSPGHDGETAAVFDDGGAWLFGTLANYNSASHTLTDGFFFVFNGGTIGWRGADVITNQNGTMIVSGASSKMIDQNNNLNAFRNIAVNNGGFTVADGYSFTTAGNFTNNGGLEVTTGNGATSVLTISGSLTNFDAATHTLTGGYYHVETNPGTATLRFPNADIRTLSNATIKLGGAGASITDIAGQNALRNLAGIQGSNLTSAGTLVITPSGGTFTNNGSIHTIDTGANITVQGNYNANNGATINVSAPTSSSNTNLTINNTSTMTIIGGGLDMGGQPGVNTQYHSTLQVINGIEFRGAYLTGTGTTFADIGLIQGSVFSPGHSPGQLAMQGALTMDNTTTTKIDVGGYPEDNNLDQVMQSGGTLTLGGKLLISMLNDFEQSINGDDTFDIITSSGMLAGSFSNAASGARIATDDGKGTFVVTYNGTSKVTLGQFLPPPRVVDVTKTPGEHFTIYFLGYPNSTYDLQASPDMNPDNFVTIATLGTGAGGDYSVFATEDAFSSNYTRRFYRVVYPDQPQARAAARSASVRKG